MIKSVLPQKNLNEIQNSMGDEARRTDKETATTSESSKERKTCKEICCDEKTKTKQQASLTIQLREINKKILTKEGRQPDAKEAKRFWRKIWEQKEDNKKAEWTNNIKKDNKHSKKALR